MDIHFKLNMVSMPNFISYNVPPGLKQDGIKFGQNSIPVEQLTKEQAEQYAEEMKAAFLDHWQKRQPK